MATSKDIDRIFAKLDERIPLESLGTTSHTQSLGEAKAIAESTSDKEYRKLMRNGNCTSHSKLALLHKCPRLYEIEMLRAVMPANPDEPDELNADFAYGHSVGAGIQAYAATGNLVAAQFAAFLAWKAPWDFEKLDKNGNPTGKSLPMALHAIESFAFFMANSELADYEVFRLPNGKPAVELSFAVDTENGYYHFGHIDTILIHRATGKLAVWEGKTTGSEFVDEATYGNSYQALGYSVVVDALASSMGLPSSDYEVLYIVYSSKSREFQLLPFPKSRTQRAEWLQDLLLTHATIDKYQELQFFPKRGDSCLNKWGKKCRWYGNCQMRNESLFPGIKVPTIESVEQVEAVDYKFTLTELIAAQRPKGT
jgi:hypothetical protein